MNKALLILIALATLFASVLPGPGRDQSVGTASGTSLGTIPADAECAECGMSIADFRFAARMVVERDGELRKLYFDDAGCALDHERWHPDLVVRERAFAVDARPRWAPSAAVWFIVNPKIFTPMGTGLIAVDAAEATRMQASGERVEPFAEAAAFRKQSMESRFGKPRP
jgi:hypothetical protein